MYINNKQIKLLMVTLLSILPLSTGLAAGKPTFTVGVQSITNYLPYSEYHAGEYTGFNREVLDLFAQSRGYKFVYKALPVKRLHIDFINGQFDLKYPDNPYWSSELKKGKNIIYSNALVEYIDGVMVLPKNKGKGKKHLKILGVHSGFTPFAYQELIQSGTITTQYTSSYEGLLKITALERVDGAYSNIVVNQFYLKQFFDDQDALVFDPELPYTRSYRHLSSLKHPELIAQFNQFLKDNCDEVEKIKQKYRVEEGLLNKL